MKSIDNNTVSGLIKELKECKKKLENITSTNIRSTPLYSSSKSSSNVRNNPLYSSSSKSSSISSDVSNKSSKKYNNMLYSSEKSLIKKRPVGRPPLKCEDIKNKTRRKTKENIEKKTKERCIYRNNNKYDPYKCSYIDDKCMTITKVVNNNLFNNLS